MTKGDYKTYKFQKNYPSLNNKLLKTSKELFEIGVLVALTSEAHRGFIVKKQLKTNSKGTAFNYVLATKEEIMSYLKDVREKYKSINMEKLKDDIDSKIEKECAI